jgi:hypothetical protein
MQMPRVGSETRLPSTPSKIPAAAASGASTAPSSAAGTPEAAAAPLASASRARSPPSGTAAAVGALPALQHRRSSSTGGAGAGDAPYSARRPSSGVCEGRRQVEQEIIYEKLPTDIAERFVLLMDPILGSGNSATRAIQVPFGSACILAGNSSRRQLPPHHVCLINNVVINPCVFLCFLHWPACLPACLPTPCAGAAGEGG